MYFLCTGVSHCTQLYSLLARHFKKQFPLEGDGKTKIIAYGLNYTAYIRDKWHFCLPIKIIIITTELSESLIAFE